MKTSFQTERLDVFKIVPEREDDYTATDVYLAFHRCGRDVWPYHPVLMCCVQDGCIKWISNEHMARQGLATELLAAIAVHGQLRHPLYPDVTIGPDGEGLFAKHRAWFESQGIARKAVQS